MTEKSLLRLHLTGMLSLVLLLTLALGGYFTLQQTHSLRQESQAAEQREQQLLQLGLQSALQTLRSYLQQMRQSAEQNLQHSISQQTELAWQIADDIYRKNRALLPEDEIRRLIVETLRPLRLSNGRGYYFIDDLAGNCVLLPIAPEREGQSLLDNRDDQGHYIMRGLLEAADNAQGSGFSRYRWYAPNSQQMLEKIAHVRRFEPFGWLIGNGDYLQYAEETLRQQALEHLRNTRIGSDGYISVLDRNGRVLLAPGSRTAEGRLSSELPENERRVVEQILQISRNGGGFLNYQWFRPGGNQLQPKLSLVSNLDEWGWILVSGAYLDDQLQARQQRQQMLKDNMNRGLLASLGILVLASSLALLFSLLYSQWLGRRFAQYRRELETSQDRLRHMAETDQLTGLANALRLADRLEHAIAASQESNNQIALLCLDLDHFKNINDSLGHSIGDQLLQQVAIRLNSVLRPGDTLCRAGGDDFVLLLENLDDSSEAASIASQLLEVITRDSFCVGDLALGISLSIGIALHPNDGADAQSLRRNADAAMYHAKARGRNNFQFFNESMNQRAREHLQLENGLRHALQHNELRLVYQPKVDLKTGQLCGCEALLRWYSPELGEVSPVRFIPIAEESGLIDSIGEWVLLEACRQSVRWQAIGMPPLRIAVNVSARQFSHCDLPAQVARALQETGLQPELLELELTESVLAENHQQLQQTLLQLRAMGIHLTMDDFGTGFSSLSYLNLFRLDTLKIDRAFICDLPGNDEHRALTAAILAMASALDMHCVAEGIETAEQMQWLHQQGCHTGQGYLFARPLSVETMTRWWYDNLKRLNDFQVSVAREAQNVPP